MSFLAPWFVVAGVAAVALPILFHLFRRTPKGRMPFSTLMFLSPSPPRLTSRSRLENWPLLLLRALVIVLLALTFGRPLLRQFLELKEDVTAGRRIVVLVDASASMRRGDLWARALAETEKIAGAATPHDDVAVMTFDHRPHTLVTFDAWRTAPVDQRAGLVRAAMLELQPTWNATRLDEALIAAAEMLDVAERDEQSAAVERERRIVLVGDMQAGAATAGLQRFEWPKGVDVEVITLTVPTTNAGLHALAASDDAPEPAAADAVRNRVLVTNAATSGKESFTLAWKIAQPTDADRPAQAYVPPGQARVVRAPPTPPGDAAALVLAGDDESFDNTLWIVPPTREEIRVLHLADERADDPQTLRYFLTRALGSSPGGRRFAVETVDPHAADVRPPTERDLESIALVTIAGSRELPPAWRDALAPWLQSGGVACCVLLDDVDASWRSLVPEELTKPGRVTLADPVDEDYALWESIDLRHPLFAPLADPRFADFSKIRFVNRRKLTLDDEATKLVTVPVRFDSGDPAIVEVPRGAGRVFLFASGWQPRESGLGTSSKFLPIIATMAELGWRKAPVVAQVETGTTIDLAQRAATTSPSPLAGEGASRREADEGETSPTATAASVPTGASKSNPSPPAPLPQGERGDRRWTVTLPGGETTMVTAAAPSFTFAEPGLYEIRSAAGVERVAANLPVDESKTAPLPVEALEALGVRLAKESARETPATVEEKRQLQVRDLEARQQLWRWCLMGALCLVVVETWYAGRVARRDETSNHG